MPVIVGVPRSGTTLLRFMLNAHCQLAIPPENGFIGARILPLLFRNSPQAWHDRLSGHPDWNAFGVSADAYLTALKDLPRVSAQDALRTFYRLHASTLGKTRWGDKTPKYTDRMWAVERLLPEARFIHIIRDGRDVALSLRRTNFSPGNDIRTLALFWRRMIAKCRRSAGKRNAYMEVRYDAVVRDPETELRKICDFIDISYDPNMLLYWTRTKEDLAAECLFVENGHLLLSPPDMERSGNWRLAMSPQEQREFLRYAGSLLAELGFEV